MSKTMANVICIGGIASMLAIAQLPLGFNVGIGALTTIGLININKKNDK